MKFIFDFDDVLFHNTKLFKEHMYVCLEKIGVPRNTAEAYYKEIRVNKFWLKELITHFSVRESFYKELLYESKNFINKELFEIIKKLGKLNCYIVTHGGEEWQIDKIEKTGVKPLFSEIFVVWGSKKEAVEKICAKHKNEKVIFIDDKTHHFEDLDFKKYPNLKTILYTGQDLASILSQP